MVLLSTVVMHHHHNERICVAFEMCVHGTDADIEAEGEANHSHRENGSCRIHQLHKFIINSSVAKNLRRHIADGNMLAAILLRQRRGSVHTPPRPDNGRTND